MEVQASRIDKHASKIVPERYQLTEDGEAHEFPVDGNALAALKTAFYRMNGPFKRWSLLNRVKIGKKKQEL